MLKEVTFRDMHREIDKVIDKLVAFATRTAIEIYALHKKVFARSRFLSEVYPSLSVSFFYLHILYESRVNKYESSKQEPVRLLKKLIPMVSSLSTDLYAIQSSIPSYVSIN